MPKFQTRRVTIDAQQWWPPGHPSHDPSMLTHPGPDTHIKLGDLYLAVKGGQMGIGGEDWYSIQTPSGTARVKPGDWIITGPRKDIIDKYPCDPVTFAAKYEALDDTTKV